MEQASARLSKLRLRLKEENCIKEYVSLIWLPFPTGFELFAPISLASWHLGRLFVAGISAHRCDLGNIAGVSAPQQHCRRLGTSATSPESRHLGNVAGVSAPSSSLHLAHVAGVLAPRPVLRRQRLGTLAG
jgi:hypothetical protein